MLGASSDRFINTKAYNTHKNQHSTLYMNVYFATRAEKQQQTGKERKIQIRRRKMFVNSRLSMMK